MAELESELYIVTWKDCLHKDFKCPHDEIKKKQTKNKSRIHSLCKDLFPFSVSDTYNLE